MFWDPSWNASRLNLLRTLTTDDVVIIGIAWTKRFFEVDAIGVLSKEEMSIPGVVALVVKVVVVLEIFILSVCLHQIKKYKGLESVNHFSDLKGHIKNFDNQISNSSIT